MMTETEFPCGAYDSRTAKNENKQMPANNADVQMEHPGENSSDPALSSQSGYAAANPQKLHPSIKKDNVQMEHPGVSGSDSALSSPSGYTDTTSHKLPPSSKKMWAGRTAGVTDAVADDFNSSIRFDQKMYRQDICGSIAHAAMLNEELKRLDPDGLLPETDARVRVRKAARDRRYEMECALKDFDAQDWK